MPRLRKMLRKQAAGAGLAFNRLFGNRAQSVFGNRQFDAFHLEQCRILLNQCIFRFYSFLRHGILGSHFPQSSQVLGQFNFHSKYSSLVISPACNSCWRKSHSRINSSTRPYWKYIPTGGCAGQSSPSLYRTAVSSAAPALPGLRTSWNRRIAPGLSSSSQKNVPALEDGR